MAPTILPSGGGRRDEGWPAHRVPPPGSALNAARSTNLRLPSSCCPERSQPAAHICAVRARASKARTGILYRVNDTDVGESQTLDVRRQEVHAELERVRRTFAQHVAQMTPADLGRASNGTRWTNRSCSSTCFSAIWWCAGCCRWSRGSDACRVEPVNRSPRSSTCRPRLSTGSTMRVRWGAVALSAPSGWLAGLTRRLRRSSAIWTTERAQPAPGHALPNPPGPLLQGLHDARRHLPLPDAALRPPRPSTEPLDRRCTGSSVLHRPSDERTGGPLGVSGVPPDLVGREQQQGDDERD